MKNIVDNGCSTSMQYDRWDAARKAKEVHQSPAERVAHHPATFCVVVYVLLAAVALAILKSIGALQPFLGN